MEMSYTLSLTILKSYLRRVKLLPTAGSGIRSLATGYSSASEIARRSEGSGEPARAQRVLRRVRTDGLAELARATYNRKVIVQEAEAKKEAAKLLGEAEVARAGGLAEANEANEIVGNSLGGPENYIRYLWIQQIDKVSGQG
jgi:hypothetical protein